MTIDTFNDIDVLVIGAGNAAANAALSAREGGAKRIVLLESAPQEARGGNSAFTGGAFRFVYESVDDLLKLAPDIADLDLLNLVWPQRDHLQSLPRLLRIGNRKRELIRHAIGRR